MTAGSLFPPRWWKEIRGLSPAWLACLATLAVAASLGSRLWAVGLFAYFLGTVALGGLSVGHEYNCRTLTLLLSQPASRARLFLEKLSVLASMLLVLCGVAWLALFDPDTQWGLGARWTRLDVLAIVVYAGALGMLLRYAMTNHHSAEGGTARAWKQVSTLVVFLAIGISLWSGTFGLFAAAMTERIRLMVPG